MATRRYENVVYEVLDVVSDGSQVEFAKRLAIYLGRPISKQTVNNWTTRGQFSRDVIPAVHSLSKVSMAKLLTSAEQYRRLFGS